MRKAFSLVELLVVISVIALLLAIGLPAMRLARQYGRETVCRSHLRQMAIILRTYTSEHDNLFPDTRFIYHSRASFDLENWGAYPACCRWHDQRMGPDSALLREHPELRGSLWPYLGDKEILRCQVGRRANDLRGCNNSCAQCLHDPTIAVDCQYTYAMNAYLGSSVCTGGTRTGSSSITLDGRRLREFPVRRTSQVTRSPSEVFAFAEGNSWSVNIAGLQPAGVPPRWPAAYDLSGLQPGPDAHPLGGPQPVPLSVYGALRLPSLQISGAYAAQRAQFSLNDGCIGDAFATYHRPKGGDLNTGFSFVALLDGHVGKVTVADQLRKSRRVAGMQPSRLGPGGNLALAWPIDVPPMDGWDAQ